MSQAAWSVVVPSLCRPTLGALLDSLARSGAGAASRPEHVVVVDDRPAAETRQSDETVERLAGLVGAGEWRAGWVASRLRVVASGGRGPAAARNAGWRATGRPGGWIVFLDDDVEV